MNATIVTAVIRHLLTAAGGGLAVKYGIDGNTLEGIIGAVSTIVGLGWSVYDKRPSKNQP